jgi:hypothetical protein
MLGEFGNGTGSGVGAGIGFNAAAGAGVAVGFDAAQAKLPESSPRITTMLSKARIPLFPISALPSSSYETMAQDIDLFSPEHHNDQ